MKFTKHLIATGLVLGISSAAFADSVNDDISLKASVARILELTGTVFNGDKVIEMDSLTGGTMTTNATLLGDLGIQSNIPGSCDLTFTSTDDDAFELLKAGDSAINPPKKLTSYTLTYGGASIGHGDSVTKQCQDHVKQDLTFIPLNDGTVLANGLGESGDYVDTITVTLTTQ